MAVQVERTDGMGSAIYPDATKWVIDDHQQLHVVGADGNLASFGRGAWDAAHQLTGAEVEARLKAVA